MYRSECVLFVEKLLASDEIVASAPVLWDAKYMEKAQNEVPDERIPNLWDKLGVEPPRDDPNAPKPNLALLRRYYQKKLSPPDDLEYVSKWLAASEPWRRALQDIVDRKKTSKPLPLQL